MQIWQPNSVLVLEDQALIALYVEDLLHQVGLHSVAAYSSSAAAHVWLQKYTPCLAVIETRLRDGTCDDIAAALTERGVPFIVHTVEREGVVSHPHMGENSGWIEKPCDPSSMIQAISRCSTRVGKYSPHSKSIKSTRPGTQVDGIGAVTSPVGAAGLKNFRKGTQQSGRAAYLL